MPIIVKVPNQKVEGNTYRNEKENDCKLVDYILFQELLDP